ncbi:MAG: prolyl oligopeptidase family serine peptidase, partial [Opitutaceae bacterium]
VIAKELSAFPRFRMNPTRRLGALLFLSAAMIAHAADDPKTLTLEKLFRPGGATHIAISPDGRYVAYTVSGLDSLKLAVVDLEEKNDRVVLSIGETNYVRDGAPLPSGIGRSEYVPFLFSLQWANSRQLVYARRVLTGERHQYDDLHIVDADGKTDRKLADEHDVESTKQTGTATGFKTSILNRRPRLIGFPPDKPGTLIMEAVDNRPSSASECYLVDLATGKRQRIEVGVDAEVLFDWQGRQRLLETERSAPLGRQQFELKKSGRLGGWDEVDAWLGPTAGVKFAHEDKDYRGSRAIPLGFDGDPNILYFASNVGRDTFGIYALDLGTKQRTAFVVEDDRFDLVDFAQTALDSPYLRGETPDSPLIFDRQQKLVGIRLRGVPSRTRWLEPKLARVQEQLNAKFPGRGVEIRDWDLAIRRAVAVVSGPSDPGRFIVFEDSSPARITEITERAPWLPGAILNRAATFEFVTPEGVRLSGSLTLPRQPVVKNPPLVVLCPDLPWWKRQGYDLDPDLPGWRRDFDRDAQALALCGFIVLKVDYRGVAGLGKAHRDAVKAGFDRVPISDIRASIERLATQVNFDRKRIALVGEGFGGYLALRALELYPEEFRAAVTFDAPTDLAAWAGTAQNSVSKSGILVSPEVAQRREFFGADKASLDKISVLSQVDAITKAVFILQPITGDRPGKQGFEIVKRLRAKGGDADYAENFVEEITGTRGTRRIRKVRDFATGSGPRWTYHHSPEVHQAINEFLTARLYDFDVKIGTEKVVEE